MYRSSSSTASLHLCAGVLISEGDAENGGNAADLGYAAVERHLNGLCEWYPLHYDVFFGIEIPGGRGKVGREKETLHIISYAVADIDRAEGLPLRSQHACLFGQFTLGDRKHFSLARMGATARNLPRISVH